MKTCSMCLEAKPLIEFYFRSDRQTYTAACIKCRRAANAVAVKEWRKQHPEQWRAYRRGFDRRRYKKLSSDPITGPAFRKKLSNQTLDYARKNRDKVNSYMKQRRSSTGAVKLIDSLSRLIRRALVLRRESGRCNDILGCSIQDYISYLESKFEPNMSWSNFGKGVGKWVVDHIKPYAAFDLNDPTEVKNCFHFSNTKPCWFAQNSSKNSRWDGRLWKHKDHNEVLL